MRTRITRALTLLTLTAAAQVEAQEAQATLYTRGEGSQVSAALVIRISPTWYLYHTELGNEKGYGQPLAVKLGGTGIEWGELVFPPPRVKHVDDEFLGKYSYNYHVGRIVAYATGKLGAGAKAASASATLSGQTCTDVSGICVPYEESAESEGAGGEKYWKGWPDSLGDPPDVDSPEDPRTGGAAPTAEASPARGQELPPGATPRPRALGPPVAAKGPEEIAGKLWVRVEEGAETARAVIELDVREGFHIYHGPATEDLGHPDAIGRPTTVHIEGGGVEWGDASLPEPERYDQGISAADGQGNVWINSHHGRVRIAVEGLLYDEFDAQDVYAEVSGQVCDEFVCQNWSLRLEVSGEGPEGAFATVQVQANPKPAEEGGSSMLAFLGLALFWGLITLLMPCTYPMIPITISFFTKQAIARDGKVLPLSLCYGAGIVAIFIAIGVVVGPVIVRFATHPVTNIVIGGLFVFFAFVLFGMVNLQPPQALNRMASKASRQGGYLGVFLMGATLVVTSFTCTAPFVGSLLGSAGTGDGAGMLRIVLGMGVFGLTMATPFVLLSLVPGKIQQLPQAGEWMNTLKVFLGFVELAAALKFISNSDLVWGWGILSREVFLLLWIVIFASAGVYLFKKALGPRAYDSPINGGLAVAAFLMLPVAAHLASGLSGRQMDRVSTAILPNYSHTALLEFFGGEAWIDRHVIVKDDYEDALQAAKDSQKLLLVNFTGIT